MKNNAVKLLTFVCLVIMLYFPPLKAQQFKVVVFTKMAGWQHDSVNAGVAAFEKLSALHHFELTWYNDANKINDKNLQDIDVIVFLLTTGDVLNTNQQQAMERFIQAGKGFMGIHSAADTEYDWPWYMQLVGRNFVTHPDVQTAKLSVIDRNFPGLSNMADTLLWTDEWYEYSKEHSPNLHYILSVDETSYRLDADWHKIKAKGMGDFHPVAWYQYYDGGRSFYTGLGHMSATYSSTLFLEHLYGGLYWAATGKGLNSHQSQH